MNNEDLYVACAALTRQERRELGICTQAELADALHDLGRAKISQRTISRMIAKDENFPRIKQPGKSKKPRNFYRVTEVHAYLSRHVEALRKHFGDTNAE